MGHGLPEQLETGLFRTKGGAKSYKAYLKKLAHRVSRRRWRDNGEIVDKAYKGYEM